LSHSIHKKPQGAFIFVDDDRDEHMLFKLALRDLDLNNKVHSCYDGHEALVFLRENNEEIFAIISDLNMPKMDGLELKRMIDLIPELKVKCIPFFFHSNSATTEEVSKAYSMNIQGYLRKAIKTEETVACLCCLINLWTKCIHPKDLKKTSG
jgi:CheY-like chemotaxis protein